MQIIAKNGHESLELRTRTAVVKVSKGIVIGDYTLPGPGEYEVQGVMADVNDTVIRLDLAEMTLGCVVPDAEGKLSESDLEELGAVDIVCLRIGDGGFATKDAATIIAQVDAPLVIPLSNDIDAVAALCGSGVACETQEGTFKITRSQLPTEGTRVVQFV